MQPAKKAPPLPYLDTLRQANLPTVSDREWEEKLRTMQQRRKHLLALVEQIGWSWKQIC